MSVQSTHASKIHTTHDAGDVILALNSMHDMVKPVSKVQVALQAVLMVTVGLLVSLHFKVVGKGRFALRV